MLKLDVLITHGMNEKCLKFNFLQFCPRFYATIIVTLHGFCVPGLDEVSEVNLLVKVVLSKSLNVREKKNL